MCTVSWIHENDGYELFCNRDEKRTRMPAEPPRLAVRDGVQYLAPIDGDYGGTWIATNEFGITLALLNGSSGPAHLSTPSRSRGLLVLDLVPQTSAQRLVELVRGLDLSLYAPFSLVALERGKSEASIKWDGGELDAAFSEEGHGMLTSSSFDSGRVCELRRQDYVSMTKEGCSSDFLLDFHQNHGAGPSAYSVCMHRPDAETVSFSRIRVSNSCIEFAYLPHAPCRSSESQAENLSRVRIARRAVDQ